MTNADKIRNMTDEELAKLIASGEWASICNMCSNYCVGGCVVVDEENPRQEVCEQGTLLFLQSEVKN